MGCGRTGATLATDFEARGHSVAVIDLNPDAFRRLPADFAGLKITGVGFDRDTLAAAGVEEAYAFAAVSDGDNSNILAARVVRETYGVENVVARIADPGRAEVYGRLGISTVAPVPSTVSEIVTRLLPGGSNPAYLDADARVSIRRADLHAGWAGHLYAQIEELTGARVAYVRRFNETVLPKPSLVFQTGDDVYVVLTDEISRRAEKSLSRPPGAKS